MEVGTGEEMLAANLCLREHLPGNLDVTPVLGSSALWDLPSQIPCLSLSYPLWVLKATPEVFILGVACLSPTRSSSSEKKKTKTMRYPLVPSLQGPTHSRPPGQASRTLAQGIGRLGCSLLSPGLEIKEDSNFCKMQTYVSAHFDKHSAGYDKNAREGISFTWGRIWGFFLKQLF